MAKHIELSAKPYALKVPAVRMLWSSSRKTFDSASSGSLLSLAPLLNAIGNLHCGLRMKTRVFTHRYFSLVTSKGIAASSRKLLAASALPVTRAETMLTLS